MKLKILVAPSLLAIAVILVVWLVTPRYFDDKLKRDDLKRETANLEMAKSKVAKANALMVDLGANADKQAVVFSFLPEEQQEEEIINDLNNIASAESVSIKNLSLVKSLETTPVVTESPEGIAENPKLTKDFNVDFTVIGAYDKIKNVVDKLYKLKRFNKISSSFFFCLILDSSSSKTIPSVFSDRTASLIISSEPI